MKKQKDVSIQEGKDKFVHGRKIGPKEAQNMGLKIDLLKKDDINWSIINEIHMRSEVFFDSEYTNPNQRKKIIFDKNDYLLF